ncbi:hypothetical protein [Paenibacillus macquariensis]|uniref:Uncharacterized protein n=1 Tax=Paenibacillus macquariensis TaxID=948756 RepID=A0ABY1JKG8_9BACL|nr:hypothetical protein [Paenibacillus macquariensis]MEC0089930.1 hypothetical protein [Paenibacillus macquariensis]OAB31180.1 hypothetical protein PMSM_20900 [Paenibacillus macquariensis subsp. macquariensis]SIQ34495.1 hypothetical protein SAMN05421578_101315 [Paenibacillus macquariensis]
MRQATRHPKGSQSKILINGRFIFRIVKEDSRGLYIQYDKQRVEVKPDPYSANYLANQLLSVELDTYIGN